MCDKGKLVSKQFEKDSIVIKHTYSAYIYIFNHVMKKTKETSFPHHLFLVAEKRNLKQQPFFLNTQTH
jgi:hypothetical protein